MLSNNHNNIKRVQMDIRQVANKTKYDFAASSYDFIAFLMREVVGFDWTDFKKR